MALSALTDVYILNPSDRDIILYNSGTSFWDNIPLATVVSSELSSVISTDESLSTDVSNLMSTDISLSTVISNLALDDLSDVIATSPSEGDVLYRISGQWQNSNILSVEISDRISAVESLSTAIGGVSPTMSLSGLTDVSLTSVINNDILAFSGSTWVNTPNLWTVSNSAVTLSNENYNLVLSNLELVTDGGALTLIDMPLTDAPTIGTEESYSFDINGNSVVRIYSEADGFGGVSNTGLVLDGKYYYMGNPTTNGSWRWFINIAGDMEFQKLITGTWTYKSKFT